MSSRRRGRDLGSASLICLGVGLALVALAFGFATGGGLIVARHRARNAADAGALAAALVAWRGSTVACAAAGRLVVENGGRLAGCTVAGPIVTVTVEVTTRTGLKAAARARAGPVQSVRGGPGEAVDLDEDNVGGG
ncbi:Rv3654c family TadE-like protein [Dactylosporangium sp. NPDC051541]|uniref:Rv3654c family TadE-like protein n=1 Tax=Dactylosporangium sp. NPDC051541 TaxID=3363977 RepID=UPI0037B6D2CF